MGTLSYFKNSLLNMENVISLSIINIIFSLINWSAIMNVLEFRGMYIGLKISLPSVIVDLWNLAEYPHQGAEINVGFMTLYTFQRSMPLSIILMLIFTFVYALAAYFYLYILFTKGVHLNIKINLKRILDLFVYYLLISILTLLLILTPRIDIVLLLYVIILLIINYFIYASPFIIVGFNKGISEAIVMSASLAWKNTYLSYTILYTIITSIISPILTLIAVNGKMPGIIIASMLVGLPGLWLALSTTLMIMDVSKEFINTLHN